MTSQLRLTAAREIVKLTLAPQDHSACRCRDRIDAGEWDKGHTMRATLLALNVAMMGLEVAAEHNRENRQ